MDLVKRDSFTFVVNGANSENYESTVSEAILLSPAIRFFVISLSFRGLWISFRFLENEFNHFF
jgi:hypothetical protein